MGESFSKKENRNKKNKLKEEKAQKMKDRKENNNKGKSLEDMLAYVDENGNLSSHPPREANRFELAPEDVSTGEPTTSAPSETSRTGRITFFNTTKGFGFITDDQSGESIFFHINQLSQPVREKDEVSFSVEKTSRGNNAVNVRRKR